MTVLASDPLPFTGLVFLLGLAVGSFLNVVIHRLPRMLKATWQAQCAELKGEAKPELPAYNLWTPRSSCPACGHQITALENIPLLSWLWLRGRCSACGARISARYPVVELLAAVLSASIAWKFGVSLATLGALLFIWALIALAFIDLDTTLLPDAITQPLLWGGLCINLFGVFTSLQSAVIGAIAGYLSLWAVYWLFKLATGREGMGYGDFKLLAAIGAWLGWEHLPLVILLSSVVGAGVGVALVVLVGHDRRIPIPFGPYLALGGAVVLFFGDTIQHAYLGGF